MDPVLLQRSHQALHWLLELAHRLCPIGQDRVAGHAAQCQDHLVGVVEAHESLLDITGLARLHEVGADGVLHAHRVQVRARVGPEQTDQGRGERFRPHGRK